MKIELDLPEKLAKDLRKKSTESGQSPRDYATQLVRKALRDQEELTRVQRNAIETRLAEGLEDLKRGRAYGPFSTHAELMVCLRGSQKKPNKRPPE